MASEMNPEDWLGPEAKKTPGQAQNQEKAQARWAVQAQEDRLNEAAEMSEEVLDWINNQSAEQTLDAEQRIFAVALATVNLRRAFPKRLGGLVAFDRVADVAWEYFLHRVTPISGYTSRMKDAPVTLTTDAEDHRTRAAAGLTDGIIQFLNDIALGRSLDPEQRVFGIALMAINMRHHFPPEMGGNEFFDNVGKRAAEYYKANGGS